MVTLVTIGLFAVLAAPIFGGIWLYFAFGLAPVVACIGVAVYAVFVIVLLMHLSWGSRVWPEPWRRAFDKVIDGLGWANWSI